MARNYSLIQEKKENKRKRYSVSIPLKIIKNLHWKKSDKIVFQPTLSGDNSSTYMVNTRIQEENNPSLKLISRSSKDIKSFNDNFKSVKVGGKKGKKIMFGLYKKNIDEDILNDIPKGFEIIEDTKGNKKIYPSVTATTINDAIKKCYYQKKILKLNLFEINHQLKNLKRRKNKNDKLIPEKFDFGKGVESPY